MENKEDFWNSILTEKSWEMLIELRKKLKFILIGGWAVWLLTRQHKSKDIDIIVGIDELEALKNERNFGKNENLKKYEIKSEEIDIDIYVEHYSRFVIPSEEIKNYTTEIEGFTLVKPELLLILKQAAFKDRQNSVKGEKDAIDIVSLLFFSGLDLKEYYKILKKYKLEDYLSQLKKMLINFKDYNYLGLNPREFKIKKLKRLEELKRV